MELFDLGFNDWFQRKQQESGKPDYDIVRVTAVNRDNYLVRSETGEALAELSGDLMFRAGMKEDFPAVGDWAQVQLFNDASLAIIYDLLPRKTLLRRKVAGKKIDYQVIAANIDAAFIVQACDFDFNLRRLERYLVMAAEGNIRPVVLLSKADLISQQALEQRISAIRKAKINCEIIAYSTKTSQGLDLVRQELRSGETYCLLGSSGVGKTTLLNHLIGREAFETAEVRQKDGKGRHITSRRQLVLLDNGAMLVDTPGIRELGNIEIDAGIGEIFADIRRLAGGCRFKDCTHTSEAGCAVLQAVRDGEIDEGRFQSYLKLLKESEDYKMSYVEKRKKERKFSKFIKSSAKEIKKFKGRG